MRTNVLEPQVRIQTGAAKVDGLGFGLDFAIVLDPAAMKNTLPKDSFFWGGAYCTWFWIDPVNEVVCIRMISTLGTDLEGSSFLRELSAKYVYGAVNKQWKLNDILCYLLVFRITLS